MRERVCRFANARRRTEALAELGLDTVDIDEILASLGGDGDAEALLDGPFLLDRSYTPSPTRFSDGSWRVFYASRNWDTAAAEIGYHVRKAAEGSSVPLFYQRLCCTMVGIGFDLCPHLTRFPFLTAPSETDAYPRCQRLAREAMEDGADALLTPSARVAGVNVPVFRRSALSEPRIVGSAAIALGTGHHDIQLY